MQITHVGGGTTVAGARTHHALTTHEITVAPRAALDLRLEVPLGMAVGYWHPGAGATRTLPADWAGRTSTSLVSWAPLGTLHDASGRSLFGWVLDESVDELEVGYGVSEEHKTFAVELHAHPTESLRRLTLAVDPESGPMAHTIGRLARWAAERLGTAALEVPELATRPVYSTWYTFTQDLDQAAVETETALAVDLGCGSVFVDDGWQREARGRGYAGCGDWLPDPAKFPDLAGFSGAIHDRGAGVVLWLAPLLLGSGADAFGALTGYAPHRVDHLECHILDPRHREVREHLADTCRRLVVDYALDGLKIDFLEQAMVYRGTPSAGDLDDVGEAMRAMLALIRAELAEAGHGDVVVEFRQPYVSPAIGAYGQILRASDCPADAVVNRRSTVDARLLSVGQVVHGDMLMWGPSGGPEAVAQQLYGCWFAVPQISMRLAELDAGQSEALRGLLALWQHQAPVVLHSQLSVHGSERGYDLVRADHSDLGRTVIGRYAPLVVDLAGPGEVSILNATPDESVVLRLPAGLAIDSGTVRSAAATVTAEVAGVSGPLVEIAVPPYGSLTLVLAADST